MEVHVRVWKENNASHCCHVTQPAGAGSRRPEIGWELLALVRNNRRNRVSCARCSHCCDFFVVRSSFWLRAARGTRLRCARVLIRHEARRSPALRSLALLVCSGNFVLLLRAPRGIPPPSSTSWAQMHAGGRRWECGRRAHFEQRGAL